jgi:hypothetical protein
MARHLSLEMADSSGESFTDTVGAVDPFEPGVAAPRCACAAMVRVIGAAARSERAARRENAVMFMGMTVGVT